MATRTRQPRSYTPAYRSGAYALLLALRVAGAGEENAVGKLSKQDLIIAAQPFCEASFTLPKASAALLCRNASGWMQATRGRNGRNGNRNISGGNDIANENISTNSSTNDLPTAHQRPRFPAQKGYTAWSCMATLIKNGIVETNTPPGSNRASRNARYWLNQEGYALAEKLWAVHCINTAQQSSVTTDQSASQINTTEVSTIQSIVPSLDCHSPPLVTMPTSQFQPTSTIQQLPTTSCSSVVVLSSDSVTQLNDNNVCAGSDPNAAFYILSDYDLNTRSAFDLHSNFSSLITSDDDDNNHHHHYIADDTLAPLDSRLALLTSQMTTTMAPLLHSNVQNEMHSNGANRYKPDNDLTSTRTCIVETSVVVLDLASDDDDDCNIQPPHINVIEQQNRNAPLQSYILSSIAIDNIEKSIKPSKLPRKRVAVLNAIQNENIEPWATQTNALSSIEQRVSDKTTSIRPETSNEQRSPILNITKEMSQPSVMPLSTLRDSISAPLTSVLPSSSTVPSFSPITVHCLAPNTYDIVLILDSREVASARNRAYFQHHLEKAGIRVLTRSLPVGDMLWLAMPKAVFSGASTTVSTNTQNITSHVEVVLDCIVERKRLDDLCASIKDSRWKEQKWRLSQSGIPQRIYLVEDSSGATSASTTAHHQKIAQTLGLGPTGGQAIRTALTQTVVWNGCMLRCTTSVDESIRYLVRITREIERQWVGKPVYYIPSDIITNRTIWLDVQKYGRIESHHIESSATTTSLPMHAVVPMTQQEYETEQRNHGIQQYPGTSHLAHRTPHMSFDTFNMLSNKSKGMTLSDVFVRMLMTVRGNSAEKARFIAKHYKTPKGFMQAYMRLPDHSARQNLLREMCEQVEASTSLPLGRRKIGKAQSSRIANIWALPQYPVIKESQQATSNPNSTSIVKSTTI